MSQLSIPVDLANPGQFFACCGLFELADRKWSHANPQAHFEDRRFVMTADEPDCSLCTLLTEFASAQCDQLDPEDRTTSPLELADPFHLRLDWWWNPVKDASGGNLKTWAGQQSGPLIFRLMKQATARAALAESPFDYAEAVFDTKDGKAKKKTISPFYFDCRRAGTSLDLGFSPDEQSMSVEAYPAVESLAMVGLQRFRPQTDENTRPRSFGYTAWAQPLPVMVAAAAVCGILQVRSSGGFRFTKPSRGGEYVSMFSRATRKRNQNA